MKQKILLIFTLLCSVFICNGQIKDIKDSPFINVSLSGILVPVFPSKDELKKQEKELKKSKKYICYLPTDPPETIDLDLRVDWFRLPDGRIATFLTAQVENKELVFEENDTTLNSRIKIFGRVTSVDKKMSGTFEDEVLFSTNKANGIAVVSGNKQSYTKGLLLLPGTYRLTFLLRDTINGKAGIRVIPLQVPKA